MDAEKKEELTVGGYVFASHEDAELARNEIKKISYIETKMDMANMNTVLSIYNKALENDTFQTPIGMEFMHGMYSMLVDSGFDKHELEPYPLHTTFKRLDLSNASPMRKFVAKKTNENSLKVKYRNSVLINLLLAVLIIALLVIVYNGPNMNAINYKAAVTNQYASWEQNLKEREQAVKDKERELNINQDN